MHACICGIDMAVCICQPQERRGSAHPVVTGDGAAAGAAAPASAEGAPGIAAPGDGTGPAGMHACSTSEGQQVSTIELTHQQGIWAARTPLLDKVQQGDRFRCRFREPRRKAQNSGTLFHFVACSSPPTCRGWDRRCHALGPAAQDDDKEGRRCQPRDASPGHPQLSGPQQQHPKRDLQARVSRRKKLRRFDLLQRQRSPVVTSGCRLR